VQQQRERNYELRSRAALPTRLDRALTESAAHRRRFGGETGDNEQQQQQQHEALFAAAGAAPQEVGAEAAPVIESVPHLRDGAPLLQLDRCGHGIAHASHARSLHSFGAQV
jgi:hypothetical protein